MHCSLADVDEAESKWEDGQPLYAVWMASSAICFLSSLFWLQLGFLTGRWHIVLQASSLSKLSEEPCSLLCALQAF